MSALSGSRSYSMSRFLGPSSEAPWTSEARRESHDESSPTKFSILTFNLSFNLLTIIGSPDAATSDYQSQPYAQGQTWASTFESDVLARFLDPGGDAPWAPGDCRRVVGDLWVAGGPLCTGEL